MAGAGAPTHVALVRGLARTFADCLKQENPAQAIDMALAQQQHNNYLSFLSKFVAFISEVPADDRYPDCCFIEDAAVVVDDVAIVTRPGALARRGEETAVAGALQAAGFESLFRITDPATLDGGDVLQVGSDIFVGNSKRTNAEAAKQLQEAVGSRYRVHSIPVQQGLHLKSVVTAIDDNTIVVHDGQSGLDIFQHMQACVDSKYHAVQVPDMTAANVLRIGDDIIMQAGFAASEEILRSACTERGLRLHCMPTMTEFIKGDGALTCCSLLFKPR